MTYYYEEKKNVHKYLVCSNGSPILRGVMINILIMFVPFRFLKNRSQEQNESESRWQGYMTKDIHCCDKRCIWYVPWQSFPSLRLLISVFLLCDIPPALRANSTATSQAFCSVTWSTMPSFRASCAEICRPAISHNNAAVGERETKRCGVLYFSA